jgi:hypothetical protein
MSPIWASSGETKVWVWFILSLLQHMLGFGGMNEATPRTPPLLHLQSGHNSNPQPACGPLCNSLSVVSEMVKGKQVWLSC